MRAAMLLAALLLAGCQRPSAPPAEPVAATPANPSPVTSSAPVVATVPATSDYQLPGDFGPHTDRAALERRFGAANVRAGDVPGAEGETSRGIVLFPEDPTRRAYLYFEDEKALRGLSSVGVFDMPSEWRLDNGVRIGMPLAELIALNGKPIEFTGFDWDYGGAISNWNGGRLQPAEDAPVARVVRLGHAEPEAEAEADAYPMGDATFSSDDPRYPRLGRIARVDEIGVSFATGE